MPWRSALGGDRSVEVVLDRAFRGDLLSIAKSHPVWVVETDANLPLIQSAWKEPDADLYEICSAGVPSEPYDSEGFLRDLIVTLHSHYNWSDPRWEALIVRGLELTEKCQRDLADMGFRAVAVLPDGFVASVPGKSENLLDYA
jgi:hypothetical protein